MGRSVGELLDSLTSHELAEWQAYEMVSGPIDRSWSDEALASSVEKLHDLMYLISQANFTDKSHRKGPIKQREEPYIRPSQVYKDPDTED